MPELKLGKLPDRTPAKITITVSPDLHRALQQYGGAYQAAYGEAETIAELIPFMLAAFLEGDRGFARAQKDGLAATLLPTPRKQVRRGRRSAGEPVAITNEEAK